MSELIKHECGIGLLRLKKPLEYFVNKYGTWQWALKKAYLLMEKQHNRGQDGAGLVVLKQKVLPGKEYIFRVRSIAKDPIKDIFSQIDSHQRRFMEEKTAPADWLEENMPFVGEIYMLHLRYGTFGKNDLSAVHPVLRRSSWRVRALALAGNFNLTNVEEIFNSLILSGQHPREYSDTISILELVGYYIDEEVDKLYKKYRSEGYSKAELTPLIQQNIDIAAALRNASKDWDGGYVIEGVLGHGDAFVMRDPWGIRPAYFYENDEIFVVTSERPVIQTVFGAALDDIKELEPGYAIIIRKNGYVEHTKIREPQQKKSCSFERIYFSRGSDADIYKERKKLGELLVPAVLKAVDYDLDNTVFSYIPNTAETAFLGLIKGIENYLKEQKIKQILQLDEITEDALRKIIYKRPRVEKIAIKDIKLRTFITQDNERDDLVKHVYDVTYGIVKPSDNLVIIDDSIVRGTTLKQSIIRILDMLNPKRIIIVSSAPQIRYPDCYGIDMANLHDLIAFRAAIELLHERGKSFVITEVYKKAKAQENLPAERIKNYVKEIYSYFTDDEISEKISQMLKTQNVKAELKIIYQTVENLHKAIPGHKGDWYFTGDYPTPGGNKVVNTAFINYFEGKKGRSY